MIEVGPQSFCEANFSFLILYRFQGDYFNETLGIIKPLFFIRGKLNYALNSGVKSVVAASSDVLARNDFSAALANHNLAGFSNLPRLQFYPQIFWLGISAQSCDTSRLSCCHTP